jgi:hypothetical protein
MDLDDLEQIDGREQVNELGLSEFLSGVRERAAAV